MTAPGAEAAGGAGAAGPPDRPAGPVDDARAAAVLVVVPTYDEADNIRTTLDRVLAAGPQLEVLVVDDASPDGTAALVAAHPGHGSRVHLLERRGKEGLGAAYRAGFAEGRRRGYDVLVEMDADLSHPADRLPALLAALEEGADLAIGSRYVPGGGTAGWPWHRRFLSRGGNAYIRTCLRLGVHDATAGFRAFRAPLLDLVDVTSLTSNGYCFQVETTLRSVRAGAVVTEVPIVFVDRSAGSSKMGPGIVAEALWRVSLWALEDATRSLARRRVTGGRRRRRSP